MSEALWLAVAMALSFLGMAWLALAMPAHWRQVRSTQLPAATALMLRLAGITALIGSALSCLAADYPSMAMLVWVMLLTAAAFAVSMVLSRQPALLRAVVPAGLASKRQGQRH